MQGMLSADHNGIKLQISKRKLIGKSHNTSMWRLDQTILIYLFNQVHLPKTLN